MAKTATEVSRIAPEVLAGYEPVIGLEVHVQLKTETKIFCACSTRFGDPPNANTCPVCLGLPGSLPVMNKKALEFAVRAALALHLHVEESSRFARKNYFYPDLPKGHQISMYELPLAVRGWLKIEDDGKTKRIGITRLHLEEDAAKNLHEGFPDSAEKSYVDYNRGGIPLAEIVSEPDLRSPAEAHAYLTALKQILQYAGISDCDMEKGTLRCDANVSVRRRGAEKFGVKAEVKNLNSFRYLQRALEYEIERQIGVLESGGRVDQETRLWNVAAGRTEAMRSKEFAHDYRYFPDPDLLPVRVTAAQIAEIAAHMPELPDARRARLQRDYGLSLYDASFLTSYREFADYFEKTILAGSPPKLAASWFQTELMRLMKQAATESVKSRQLDQTSLTQDVEMEYRITPKNLAELLVMIEKNEITGAMAKKMLARMFETGGTASQMAASEGLQKIDDNSAIEKLCNDAIAASPDNAAKYRAGNQGVFNYFVGQVMKAARGQANPQIVQETLRRLLG